jgi:hypothetical protein
METPSRSGSRRSRSLVRDLDETKPYTLALATTDLTTTDLTTTDLTSTAEQIVARYASRWSIEQSIKDAKTSSARATPKTDCPPRSSAPHPWDWRT